MNSLLSKTIPKIRFKGFSENWEEKELGDISKIIGGGTPDTNVSDYWNGNINWYSPEEIANTIYVRSSNRKITELGYKKSSTHLLPAYKTILFTSRAGIGKMAILGEEATTNQGFQSLVIEEESCNVYFVYSMGNSIKNKAIKIASGSTFLEISGQALASIRQFFPILQEQTQIGNFFQKLDEFIELQQKTLEQIQTYKKAMLQKMFPQQGETVPQMRFKGFSEDWMQNALGFIVSVTKGKNLNQTDLVSGNYPVIAGGKKSPYICNKYTHEKAITISASGAYSGYVSFHPHRIWASDCSVIKSNHNCSLVFIYQFLKFKQEMLYKLQTGGAQPHVYPKDLEKIKMRYPSLREQIQIGKFFQKLDDLIEQHKFRLEHYKTFKKAMLQRLFV